MLASASFDRPPAGESVVLEVETDKGEVLRQVVSLPAPALSADAVSTVARVAAAARLKEADEAAGLQIALRYRLVSPWTNWLVIAARPEAEKAVDMPALRKVPQTMAAGWAGMIMVDASMSVSAFRALSNTVTPSDAFDFDEIELDDAGLMAPALPADLPEPYCRLINLVNADASRLGIPGALALLTESGLAAEFDRLFRHAARLGIEPEILAAILVARLLTGPLADFVSDDAALERLAGIRGFFKGVEDALRRVESVRAERTAFPDQGEGE